MPDAQRLVIYGAYGYTGRLIVEQALKAGLQPQLAGRDARKLKRLASETGLEYTTCDINDAHDDTQGLRRLLHDAVLVLHCAGPFHRTVKAMSDACIATGTHYLDITGEIEVFEYLAARSDDAKAAGVMLLPGVGFDVVPTDCMAAHLKSRLPDATELKLAFYGGGGMSRGTLLTMIDNFGEPGAIRQNGKIVPVPTAFDVIDVDFGEESGRDSWSCMTIPWGDVSTAFHTTGIPDIRVYTAVPPKTTRKMKFSRHLGWLLRREFVRNVARRKVKTGKPGPGDATREKSKTFVWGQARNAAGDVVAARQVGPNGYSFTAIAAVAAAKRVLGKDATPGFRTPALQFGADFCLSLGVEREDVS